MIRMFQKRRHLPSFTLLPLLLVLLTASSSLAAIEMTFEVPAHGQKVSGIGSISGWAFSTTGAAVTVTVEVDNGLPSIVPCCGERQDVANVYGPFGFNSGFGQVFNFNILSEGNHTIVIRGYDGTSETLRSHQISVVKPGGFEFLTRLDLAFANATIDNNEIEISGAYAVDKASLEDREVTLRLAWRQNSQTLTVVNSRETGLPVLADSLIAQDSADTQSAFTLLDPEQTGEIATDIQLAFENPPAGRAASGVGVLSGWTFSPNVGAIYPPIVEFSVDGGEYKRLPCCQERKDVAANFPGQSNLALQSGFGSVFNVNTLSSAPHNIEIRVRDNTGAEKKQSHEVVAVKPGGFEFLDRFDLSQAQVTISGLLLVLDFVKVREKATQQVKEVSLRYKWERSCQCFVVQGDCGNGLVEPVEECDGPALDGQTCQSLGFNTETSTKKLKCTSSCMLDTTSCTGGPRLFVTNFFDDSVSVINTATNQAKITTISVGTEPRGIAVNPTSSTAYVTNFLDDTVSVINTATEQVSKTIELDPDGKTGPHAPHGIAVSPNGTRVYVANSWSDSVAIINAQTGNLIDFISVGTTPQDIALSVNGARAYVTNLDDNTVSVINTATNTVIATIPVGEGPEGIAISPKSGTNLAYVANRFGFPTGTAIALDTSTNTRIGSAIRLGLEPVKVAFPSDGSKVYIANFLDDLISVIDPTTKDVLNGISTPDSPMGIAVTPNGKRLYIALHGLDSDGAFVQVVSTLTHGKAADFIEVGTGPFGVAIVP